MIGNREALLTAARTCLLEKGFARTTARDIAAASGVSLAAIGYHFGTKEQLLTVALLEAIEELDAEFRTAARAPHLQNATPLERFEAAWARLIESFATHRRMWIANLEIFAQAERIPALRQLIDDGLLQRARKGLVSLFEGVDEATVDGRTAGTKGSFYYALVTGVLVQWIIDPGRAPSARDLAEALAAMSAELAIKKAVTKHVRT